MKPTRDDLQIDIMSETGAWEGHRDVTDADLAAMGYVKLEGIDVEALREVVQAPFDPWSDGLTEQEIDVLWDFARQVLAALDGEEA